MSDHIGYLCDWKHQRETTWSHSAYSLFESLRNVKNCEITDIDVKLRKLPFLFHQLKNISYFRGIKSSFRFDPAYVQAVERNARKLTESTPALDAVIEIGDVFDLSGRFPFYIYVDLSIDVIFEYKKSHGTPLQEYEQYSDAQVLFRRDRQRKIFDSCSGIFCMSHWIASQLTAISGIPTEKLHVVHAGMNVAPASVNRLVSRDGASKTVLFIGRNFFRKGGDLLIDSFPLLRERIPGCKLIIAGPARWPLPAPAPAWVEFLGNADWPTLQEAFARTDLFCMPSRFDAFGIVFVEALSNGIPVIGRNCYAMPEFIKHSVNGFLLDTDDPVALGNLMYEALINDDMKLYCIQHSDDVRRYYSWERVAEDMVNVIRNNGSASIT